MTVGKRNRIEFDVHFGDEVGLTEEGLALRLAVRSGRKGVFPLLKSDTVSFLGESGKKPRDMNLARFGC